MLYQMRGSIVDMADRCHLRSLGDELVNIIASERYPKAHSTIWLYKKMRTISKDIRGGMRGLYTSVELCYSPTHPVVMDKEWNLDDLPPPV